MSLVLSLLLLVAPTDSLPPYVREHYARQDHRIPMRDGVRLFTSIYSPRDTSRPLPLLLSRTPYGSDKYLHPTGPAERFAKAGYIFVFQDVRGKYRSEGTFVDVPPRHPASAGKPPIDESTGCYATTGWPGS